MFPDQHLNYIDLLKYTTSGKNSEVDQRGLHRMIQNNPAHAIDWGQRILRCSEDTINTVIYVGGKTANLAWTQVVKHERLVGHILSGDPNGPHAIYYPDHNGIIAVVGGVHPSAHLMAGGEVRMTERFDDAMMLTRSLLGMSPFDRSMPAKVHSAITSMYNDRQKLEVDRRKQLSALDPSANWSLLTLTHNVTWNNVQNLIATFSLAFLLMFMNLDSGIAFLSATVDAGSVLQLFATKCRIDTAAQWRKIWCDSVASALASPKRRAGFFAAIEKFATKCNITTAAQWCKVMSGSVASALASPERRAGFFAALEKFSTKCKITTAAQWGKVMCNSVAAALADPDERDAFIRILDQFEHLEAVTIHGIIGSDCFSSRAETCVPAFVSLCAAFKKYSMKMKPTSLLRSNKMMMVILPVLAKQASACGSESELTNLITPFKSSKYCDKTRAAKLFATTNNIEF
jgi:hypothetical protein